MAVRKVGAVAIEAISDTAGWEKDLETGLKKAVSEAAKDSTWDPLVSAAGKAGERASAQFTVKFKSTASSEFEVGEFLSFRKLGNLFTKAGETAGDFFTKAFAGAAGAAGTAFDLFKGIGQQGLMGGLSAAIGGGPAALASILVIAGLLVVAIPLLTAAFFALGAAVVSLVGALALVPSVAFGVVAAFAPLIIAFQGFGEALSALTSGDLDKLNEALKNLTPSAAGFVREIQRLMPFFSGTRKMVQEAFFVQVLGSLDRLIRGSGGVIAGGLANIASAMGGLVNALFTLASRPETAEFLARLFGAVSEGITEGTPAIVRFAEALMTLADAGIPIVERLLASLGGEIDKFATFLEGAAADGSLGVFLENSLNILMSIGGTLKEITLLAGAMFGNEEIQSATVEFFNDLNKLLAELTAWFQSPEGEEFLENISTLARDFWNVLDTLVLPAVRELFGAFADFLELLDDVGDALDRIFGRTEPGRSGGRGGRVLGMAAEGGITQGPVIAGEAGTEAILPLDDPIRARQIASDPMVQNVIGGAGDTIVYAYFDGEPFQARIVRTTRSELASTSRQLTQKPRTVLA